MKPLTSRDPIPATDADALPYLPSGERWRACYYGLRRHYSVVEAMVKVLTAWDAGRKGRVVV